MLHNSFEYLNHFNTISPKQKKKVDSLYSATPDLPSISIDEYGGLRTLQRGGA